MKNVDWRKFRGVSRGSSWDCLRRGMVDAVVGARAEAISTEDALRWLDVSVTRDAGKERAP